MNSTAVVSLPASYNNSTFYATLDGLLPGVTYHFRIVATKSLGATTKLVSFAKLSIPQIATYTAANALRKLSDPDEIAGFICHLARLSSASGQMFQLVLHFFLGHIDIFRRSDAVDNQLSLYIVLGAILIPLA